MTKSRFGLFVLAAMLVVAIAGSVLPGAEPHRRPGSRPVPSGPAPAQETGDAAQMAVVWSTVRASLAARLEAARLEAARRARAAHRHHGPVTTRLCRQYQHVAATGTHGARLVVRNDSYGGSPECLTNVNRWANFLVASSAAHHAGREPVAYPDIFYGCSWGVCSKGTTLPRRLSRLRDPVTSWYTAGNPPGQWDAAYDIWFARRPFTDGQDHGAEVMLWLRSGGLSRPSAAHSLLIDGRRWQLDHWITRNPASGDRWPLIIFRMTRPCGYVRHLALMPFFRRVEELGLLHRSWWLTAVEAGFEVWRGGTGLRTTSFWVRT